MNTFFVRLLHGTFQRNKISLEVVYPVVPPREWEIVAGAATYYGNIELYLNLKPIFECAALFWAL